MPRDRRELRHRNDFWSIEEAELKARRRLPRSLYTALAAGSESGVTARANCDAFETIGFYPRVAVVHDERRLSTTVLGREVSIPVLIAPIGKIRVVHPAGAIAGARAAAEAGTISVVPNFCGHPLEEVAQAGSGGRTWLQLGAWPDRNDACATMEQAAALGYEALVITLDASVSPVPPSGPPVKLDLQNMLRFGPEMVARPGWFTRFVRDGFDLSLASMVSAPPGTQKGPQRPSWDDFTWIRKSWSGPIVAKGVTTADDARRAVHAGVDAIIVSNHGGKSLDGSPATLRALPDVVAAVGSDVEVLLDGGVRRGADVVKAVALGAKAVLIGRPYVWGLAVGGEAGVRRVLDIFGEGIDRTLGLIGCPSIDALDASFLDPAVASSNGRSASSSPSLPVPSWPLQVGSEEARGGTEGGVTPRRTTHLGE